MVRKSIIAALAAVVSVLLGLVGPQQASAEGGASADGRHVYTQPGQHHVNDRYWFTECEMYSTTVVRCITDIWATTVTREGGRYQNKDGWVFNNLTYLPGPRAEWEGNPLAQKDASWTSEEGRRWRTECDTQATGGNGCRSYIWSTQMRHVDGRFVRQTDWVFNNIVQFSDDSRSVITTIPARSADVANFPPRDGVAPVPAPTPTPTPVAPAPVAPAPTPTPDRGNGGNGNTNGVLGTCGVSYYADYFDGRRTANGEIFRQDQMTAAHKTLPFNTMVRVTNRANGQSVTVRINDRGPFISGRCIDLSRSAMEAIGGIRAGVITGDYEILPAS